MAVRLSALHVGCPLFPGRFLVLISVRGWVDPTVSAAGKFRSTENSNDLIGNWTHVLLACSTVPQPIMLLKICISHIYKYGTFQMRSWYVILTLWTNFTIIQSYLSSNYTKRWIWNLVCMLLLFNCKKHALNWNITKSFNFIVTVNVFFLHSEWRLLNDLHVFVKWDEAFKIT
jgi:hypothetical protein